MEGAQALLGTTDEITAPPPTDRLIARLERWRLQSVARSVLPDERVALCCRRMIPMVSGVGVWKTEKAARYSGLRVCGSIWLCPICAAKISEGRRVDLKAGIARWRKQGGNVFHLILTVPHYDHQPLREVLQGFMASRRLLKHRKTWRTVSREIGLVGLVRGLETTWGRNGWHVHSHELMYVKSNLDNVQDLEQLTGRVLEMWQKATVTAGIGKPNERGVVIQDGSHADRYAAKWGLESEVTKGHIKAGRDGNHSPWDLLRGIGKGIDEWINLFHEYAKAFTGRHQLEWSRGLRQLLGLGSEVSDGDLAATLESEAEFMGLLGPQQWNLILKAEKRGELLEVAHKEGWRGVIKFINTLIEKAK